VNSRLIKQNYLLAKYIQSHGVKLDPCTNNDMLSIMQANKEKAEGNDNQFCKLFWEQQLKAKSLQAFCHHPMVFVHASPF